VGFETKAFGAQDALVSALQASATLSDWFIDYGLPARREEQHIWVDERLTNWTQGNATTGLVQKEEQFRISVYVYSRLSGSTAEEQRDDIKAAADIVSNVIGSAPFLGGSVFYAQIASAEYEAAYADAEGRQREGVMLLTIQCSAYLTA
jgi:hypothetical protein